MPPVSNPVLQQTLAVASQHLQRGDLAGAERLLLSLHTMGQGTHPDALHMLGAVRLNQRRFAEAEPLFRTVRAAAPREPLAAYHLAEALAGQGRVDDAVEAYRAAIKLKPDFVEARFNVARTLHGAGRLEEAEKAFRDLLRLVPGHALAKFALGVVLTEAGKPQEAGPLLDRALQETADPGLSAQIQTQRAMVLRLQHRHDDALAAADAALAIHPASPEASLQRAAILQALNRHEEALAILQGLLARVPGDPGLHHALNDLLYRMGREADFLKSYDRAPPSRPLQLGKAFFLSHAGRDAECHDLYAAMALRDPQDKLALLGAAKALVRLDRAAEAGVIYDTMLEKAKDDPGLFGLAAEAALLQGDASKAAWLCEQGLQLAPRHGVCLAHLGLAWRMQDDDRDEALNGYDSLVQVFDLEAPEGFSSMADFNAELDAGLKRLHPAGPRIHRPVAAWRHPDRGQSVWQRPWPGVEAPGTDRCGGVTLYRGPGAGRRPSLPVAAGAGLPPCRLLVVAAERLRLPRQPYPPHGLDQLLLLCRRARCGAPGRPGLDQVRRAGAGNAAARTHPAQDPAGTRAAGAVSVLHVARHGAVSRRRGANHRRIRCRARMKVCSLF
jgi:tetratricopeptide (TPR) repeat protein